MDEAARATLSAALGPAAVSADGVLAPADAAALAEVCRACAASSIPITAVRRPAPVRSADPRSAVVSLAAFDSLTVEVARGVVRAGTAASIAPLRGALAAAGMAIAGGAALAPAIETVGDAVDAGALARRALAGIEAVTARGERIVAGGAIWKDVAGYDLAAALLGAGGLLAIVTEVTLRLQPAGSGAGAPAFAAGPARPSPVSELLAQAFDPDRLLRGAV